MAQYIVEWEYRGRPATRRSVVIEADDVGQAIHRSVHPPTLQEPVTVRQVYRAGADAELVRQMTQEKLEKLS